LEDLDTSESELSNAIEGHLDEKIHPSSRLSMASPTTELKRCKITDDSSSFIKRGFRQGFARRGREPTPARSSDRNRDLRAHVDAGYRVRRASRRRHRPKKFLRNPLQCSPPAPLPLALRWGKGMPANPLQGIQVINSVNPCSSTPLHRPIHPHHLPGAPPHPAWRSLRPAVALFSRSPGI